MHEPTRASQHAIAYLRVIGEGGLEQKLGHVACPRQGGTVPLARCARCPRFLKVTAGSRVGEEAVHCHPGEVDGEPAALPLHLPRAPVSSLMTRNVLCVRPELTLDALNALFVETGLSAIPVVDEAEHLLGFVAQQEVTLAIQLGVERVTDRPLTVADIFLPFALAVPETMSIAQAAAVMAFEGQQRLAVTSANGSVVGVLSASDILYWIARADGHVLPPPRLSCRI